MDNTTIPGQLGAIEERLNLGDQRMAGIETMQSDMKTAQDDMKANLEKNTELTLEIRDLLEMGKTGMRAINWIGRAATKLVRWLGLMAAAGLSIYAAFYALTHGGPPK